MKALKHQLGWEGIGRYWALMEIVAMKMDRSSRCHYEQSESEWLKFLGLKKNKLSLFLVCLENVFNIKVVHSQNIIRIEIPKLLKKRDDYTKKSIHKSDKLTKKSPLEVDVEVEVDTKPPLPPLNLKIENPQNSKPINPETQKLWADCLIQIKLNIMPLYFQKYFETTQVRSFEDNILMITVPNQFTRKCLIENYRELIESTLKEVKGAPILAEFCVCGPSP